MVPSELQSRAFKRLTATQQLLDSGRLNYHWPFRLPAASMPFYAASKIAIPKHIANI